MTSAKTRFSAVTKVFSVAGAPTAHAPCRARLLRDSRGDDFPPSGRLPAHHRRRHYLRNAFTGEPLDFLSRYAPDDMSFSAACRRHRRELTHCFVADDAMLLLRHDDVMGGAISPGDEYCWLHRWLMPCGWADRRSRRGHYGRPVPPGEFATRCARASSARHRPGTHAEISQHYYYGRRRPTTCRWPNFRVATPKASRQAMP